MITQHTHVSRRILRCCLAVIAGLAAIPLVTSSAQAGRSPSGEVESTLATEIEAILDLALAPGAIEWNCCGADAPPTGANAAVRIPGRDDDVVVAAGTNVDATPFDPYGPYPAGNLQENLVHTVAWQLADEGSLELDAPIDAWLPDVPNADRVTVGMLAEHTTGWGRVDKTTPIVADLSRRWTLAEVVDGVVGVTPLREPGTAVGTEAADHDTTALAYILEQVTGQSIADLIVARIVTPLGLDDTFIQDGTNQPADNQHGVFQFDGQVLDTSMVPSISYYTYFGAVQALVSTSTDLLDLLDALVAGALFTTDRAPTPERLVPTRLLDGTVYGLGTPLNGFCPCEDAAGNGMTVTAVGRRPSGVGTNVTLVRFSDGISVVLHFNSNEQADGNDPWEVALAIHDAAAASANSAAAPDTGPTHTDAVHTGATAPASLAVDGSAEPSSPEDAAFCAAAVEAEAAVLSEDSARIGPAIEALAAAAPSEIADSVDTVTANAESEGPEFEAAYAQMIDYMKGNCGFAELDVVATDYSFSGIPAELPAGPIIVTTQNGGEEMHIAELLRVNDDVTFTTDELLALPEEEALGMVTRVGGAFAVPGGEGYGIADLTPGRYLAICPIPQGMTLELATQFDEPEATSPAGSAPAGPDSTGPELGPPHFLIGMIHEFTVS
jgi:CubicO group peptidase (beta-lactamase class C family)